MKIIEMTACHRPDDTRIYHKYIKSLLKDGNEILYIAPSNLNNSENFLYSLSIVPSKFALVRLFRIIKIIPSMFRFKPNFLHIHDPELLLLCPIFKVMKFKIIYDMHENFIKELDDKPISRINRFFQKIIWNLLNIFVLNNINVVFAEASYKKYFPTHQNMPIVQNFPSEDNYINLYKPSKFPNIKPKFVYLGTITKDRGALKIIRCLENAFQDNNYELHFIGDIPNKEFEIEFKKISSINKNIFFHGFKQGKEKMQLLASCDVGLAILDPRENYIESYPTKMFEYVLCGLPVVSSNFDLYKSVVNEHNIGLCVNPLDYNDITQSFKKIVSPKEYKNFSNGVENFPIQKFTWEAEFNGFTDFLRGLK